MKRVSTTNGLSESHLHAGKGGKDRGWPISGPRGASNFAGQMWNPTLFLSVLGPMGARLKCHRDSTTKSNALF